MNLSTSYLGLNLRCPVVIGASPLADSLEIACKLEDLGAGAIVMRSLFEEQIYLDELAKARTVKGESQPAPNGVFPALSEYQLSPGKYLDHLEALKSALGIPVIASLNGCRAGGWIDFARRFEAAGADAIELNFYQFSADPLVSGAKVEAGLIEAVSLLKATVKLPIAVKLSPFYTAPAHFARALVDAGASGIVLFNRIYQPDFDTDSGEPTPVLKLSDSSELLLRLRWTALLSTRLSCSVAVTGGVNRTDDVIKSLLAGAHAVQVVSSILKHGPRYLGVMLDGLTAWMKERNYANPDEFRGFMRGPSDGDAEAVERGSYQRILQLWRTRF